MSSHMSLQSRRSGRIWKRLVTVLILATAFGPALLAERTHLKPGWNLFSPTQDVEMGRQVAQDAERQLAMLNDRRVDDYLNGLGRRLAAKAPGERYPYQFRAVNDRTINAFALPGGFLYVNRGTIEAAQSEAQLAGVIGHEIGHVALRHGTNQASKSYAAQVPLAVLGGVLGSNSIGGVLAQIGAGFAVDSILLKYSREAERQADVIGTQMLYDNGYDPRAMAQFFEIIARESKGGGRGPEWFSSHPNPENRMGKVQEEVERLGGPPSGYRDDSAEFREIRRYVQSLPQPPQRGVPARRSTNGSARGGRPQTPGAVSRQFDGGFVTLRHPDNWRAYGQGSAFTLAPDNGIVADRSGNNVLAYGVIGAVVEPHNDRRATLSLEEATDQLIDSMQRSNPSLRVVREHERERLGGEPALSTQLRNDSPLGGKEYDWLVTALVPEGLAYIVFVAPQEEFPQYERTFTQILESIRFRRSEYQSR